MPVDFGTIGGLIGIVLFLGSVAIFLRGSADKGTITSLQNSVSALQTEVNVYKTKVEEQETRLVALEKENTTLRTFVTQKDEIAQLHGLLDAHHRETIESLKRLETAVDEGE